MPNTQRSLQTRQGTLLFPIYVPVTTFGDKYPLDKLIQAYLPRLASAVMVSHHYAKQLKPEQRPRLPLMIDSGGFASLFQGSQIHEKDGLGVLQVSPDEPPVHPRDVLEFQAAIADIAFTLDFPIPPDMERKEAEQRQRLTINNALWAIQNRRRKDLPLYACVQAWDKKSARDCAKEFINAGFDGIAIGGLVPRAQNRSLVLELVEAVRAEIGDLPLHVFGLGHPEMVTYLFKAGVDSVDSSSYVKAAADGKLWSDPTFHRKDLTALERMHLALCNLAIASGKSLPLASAELIFSTFHIQR